jgi:hypothetical protein
MFCIRFKLGMTKVDLIIFVCEKIAFLFVLENHFVDIQGLVVLRHRIVIPVHSGEFKSYV